jgi:hypothetical protein
MVKFYESIEPQHEEYIMKQPVFFTGSAPLTGKHINISPKGLPSSSFSILTPNLCAYIDATGSGCETISHVHENGRVTIMFCSFDKAPQIMRLFCTGRVVEFDDPGFGGWIKRMGEKRVTAMRAVIVLDVFKVRLSLSLYLTTPSTLPYLSSSHPPGPNLLRLRRPLPRHAARPSGRRETGSLPPRPGHARPLGEQAG